MNEIFLIGHLHRRLRIGGAGLLLNLGNPPTGSAVMASQPTLVLTLKGHIKANGPQGNRRQRAKPRNDSLNPHSAVTTTAPMSPRPRGFLP